jgi:heme/copper-type cytochrome/quinol oxidase subunit 2
MQNALGLMGDQATMFAITIALGLGGIGALFMALFWPRRWRLHYRMEVAFVVLLVGIVVYADWNSSATYRAYEANLPAGEMLSGKVPAGAGTAAFDRTIGVFAFQWGFLFFDEDGAASRNAVKVRPGEKVLFTILSNDVIHGFNIPAARMTTEFEPGEGRAIWIRAPEAPGKYLIQCLNYCGLGHAQMKAWLVVDDGAEEAPAETHG